MADILHVKCPSCPMVITTGIQRAGTNLTCPSCGRVFHLMPIAEPVPRRRRPPAPWYTIAGSTAIPIILLLIVLIAAAGLVWLYQKSVRGTLEGRVANIIEEKEGVKIHSVLLVNTKGNEYDGIVTAMSGREATVHVVFDGDRVLARWLWR